MTGFRFRDLPPEIRNIVYALALQDSETLRIYTRSELRLTRAGGGAGHEMFCINASAISAALLRVSRQLNSEATPIMYGGNTFFFHRQASMLDFLKQIGNSRKHLRRIKLGCHTNVEVFRSALHLLKQATHLERFVCSSQMIYRLDSKAMDITVFLPWLKALRKAIGRRGEQRDAHPLW